MKKEVKQTLIKPKIIRIISAIITIVVLFLYGICIDTLIADEEVYSDTILTGGIVIIWIAAAAIEHIVEECLCYGATQKFPQLNEKFASQIKKFLQKYIELLPQQNQYERYVEELGLEYEGTEGLSKERIAKPLYAAIQYSRVEKTQECYDKLSICIEYLRQKEEFIKQLSILGSQMKQHLSSEEQTIASDDVFAAVVVDIDENFLYRDCIVFWDITDENCIASWDITADNLTQLRTELQNDSYESFSAILERPGFRKAKVKE